MPRSIALLAAAAALAATGLAVAQTSVTKAQLDRGRYLVQVGGCNDCHTAHYPEKAGQIPESEWLTGVPVGFQGPWGTTYPSNLRLAFSQMTEQEWLQKAHAPMRPPMPWFNVAAMTDTDLRAMYQYIRSLGAKGEPAPAYVAPGGKVATPYIVFVPQNLPPQKSAAAN